jgi:branched-chain amino acid aminotransferase
MFWLNGAFCDDTEKQFAADDRGLLLGDGLFETFLCLNGRPQFFQEHWQRLTRSAKALSLTIPFTENEIHDALCALLERNNSNPRASARLSLTRGPGPRGLMPPVPSNQKPQMMLTSSPLVLPSAKPIKVIIASVRRNEGSPASQMKTLSYMDNILALAEARGLGADDALMLNNRDYIACLSAANVFSLIENGNLITPPVEVGILPGIMREKIIVEARKIGLDVREQAQTLRDFRQGVCFASNSLMGMRRLMLDEMPPLSGEAEAAYDRLAKSCQSFIQEIS